MAIVDEPELLILDEPTVGLDPILREKIWTYLVETTRTSKLAVIITTHYIEEAKQASCVGLMRNGILLAEDKPANILIQFNQTCLEDAFLLLCQKHGPSEEADDTLRNITTVRTLKPIDSDDISKHKIKAIPPLTTTCEKKDINRNLYQDVKTPFNLALKIKEKLNFTTKRRMNALLSKNFLQMMRQPA